MRKLHVVGRKNSGKTTLIVELIRELTSRGCRVGTIKHTHHHHEFDVPGKDSFRHREAGAAIVGLVGPSMSAAYWDRAESAEADQQWERLFLDCDLVLVEGNQQSLAMKIEVWRAVTGQPPLALENETIQAVVSDDSIERPGLQIWPRTDVVALADRVLAMLGCEK